VLAPAVAQPAGAASAPVAAAAAKRAALVGAAPAAAAAKVAAAPAAAAQAPPPAPPVPPPAAAAEEDWAAPLAAGHASYSGDPGENFQRLMGQVLADASCPFAAAVYPSFLRDRGRGDAAWGDGEALAWLRQWAAAGGGEAAAQAWRRRQRWVAGQQRRAQRQQQGQHQQQQWQQQGAPDADGLGGEPMAVDSGQQRAAAAGGRSPCKRGAQQELPRRACKRRLAGAAVFVSRRGSARQSRPRRAAAAG
jgi:hypothetical protein